MSDIVKVTEEEFDNEGNLVRRVITEYRATGGYTSPSYPGTRVGDVWPYGGGMITVKDPNKYTTVNIPNLGEYDLGDFARMTAGGTDKDRTGEVVD